MATVSNQAFQFPEFVFKSSGLGPGRLFGAVFLLIWLTFWLVGETVVLMVLGRGIFEFVGLAEGSGRTGAGSVLIGAFLLVWLTIWTIGGIIAFKEFLRLMWSIPSMIRPMRFVWLIGFNPRQESLREQNPYSRIKGAGCCRGPRNIGEIREIRRLPGRTAQEIAR